MFIFFYFKIEEIIIDGNANVELSPVPRGTKKLKSINNEERRSIYEMILQNFLMEN